MIPDWKQFEMAVAAIVSALDPSATVTRDAMTPDVDTGLPRQRDAWVEGSFGGHFPIRILVSCKRKKARLNQQDIDAFWGEFQSSGANKGVIYSHAGFTKPALAKAVRRGLSCCVLIEDGPPPIPEALAFSAYCHREQLRFSAADGNDPPQISLRDAARLHVEVGGEERPAISLLAAGYDDERRRVVAAYRSSPTRSCPTWGVEMVVDGGELDQPITLRLESRWAVYRAKVEAWLLNGSYSITDQNFRGSFSTPFMDQWSAHPGPGWEVIPEPGELPTANVLHFYSYGGNTDELLSREFVEGLA